jgi:hypothetical protein
VVDKKGSVPSPKKIERRLRLIMLLDASEKAGLSPTPILQLHTFAYLSNVLAPVWEMPILDGKIYKRRGGPFYPVLQQDLDRLVGMGVVTITGVKYVQDDKRWRLEGSYNLNHPFADRILDFAAELHPEREFRDFLRELAYALSALPDTDIARTTDQDATYADPVVDFGNVVDFDEWQKRNFSSNAAQAFERLLPGGARATTGEKLHLYLRHVEARLHGGR